MLKTWWELLISEIAPLDLLLVIASLMIRGVLGLGSGGKDAPKGLYVQCPLPRERIFCPSPDWIPPPPKNPGVANLPPPPKNDFAPVNDFTRKSHSELLHLLTILFPVACYY